MSVVEVPTLAAHGSQSRVATEPAFIAEAADRLETAAPQDILRWAVEQYAGANGNHPLALACSFGEQSVVAIDMLAQMNLLDKLEIFYLDTGVLFPETHQTRIRIQDKYRFTAIRIAANITWEQQMEKFGGHLYERGPEGINECCYIRKVEPMRKYLADKSAWITGLRRGHGKTRAAVPVVMWDQANSLVKINPFAAVDKSLLWGYIKANNVPYNPLYDQGYPSIGCNTPVCTRPVKPGEDERAGRWAGVKTECGIHVDGKVVKSLDSSGL